MRTSIDLPNALDQRVRSACAERGITFRALVIEGLHRVLDERPAAKAFRLRDASVGPSAPIVSAEAINAEIDAQRGRL